MRRSCSSPETAVRWNVPLVVVVNDNRSLNQEIGPYSTAYGGELHGRHHELWHFADIDLSKVAESIGVRSWRVEKADQLEAVFAEAVEHGGPTLLDVTTDMDVLAPKGTTTPAPV